MTRQLKKGFSLIEVMIIFTILAVIMAASMPLITRRAHSVNSAEKHGTYVCYPDPDPENAGKFIQITYDANQKTEPPKQVDRCEFKPLDTASNFTVDLYSAGAGGVKHADFTTRHVTGSRAIYLDDLGSLRRDDDNDESYFELDLGSAGVERIPAAQLKRFFQGASVQRVIKVGDGGKGARVVNQYGSIADNYCKAYRFGLSQALVLNDKNINLNAFQANQKSMYETQKESYGLVEIAANDLLKIYKSGANSSNISELVKQAKVLVQTYSNIKYEIRSETERDLPDNINALKKAIANPNSIINKEYYTTNSDGTPSGIVKSISSEAWSIKNQADKRAKELAENQKTPTTLRANYYDTLPDDNYGPVPKTQIDAIVESLYNKIINTYYDLDQNGNPKNGILSLKYGVPADENLEHSQYSKPVTLKNMSSVADTSMISDSSDLGPVPGVTLYRTVDDHRRISSDSFRQYCIQMYPEYYTTPNVQVSLNKHVRNVINFATNSDKSNITAIDPDTGLLYEYNMQSCKNYYMSGDGEHGNGDKCRSVENVNIFNVSPNDDTFGGDANSINRYMYQLGGRGGRGGYLVLNYTMKDNITPGKYGGSTEEDYLRYYYDWYIGYPQGPDLRPSYSNNQNQFIATPGDQCSKTKSHDPSGSGRCVKYGNNVNRFIKVLTDYQQNSLNSNDSEATSLNCFRDGKLVCGVLDGVNANRIRVKGLNANKWAGYWKPNLEVYDGSGHFGTIQNSLATGGFGGIIKARKWASSASDDWLKEKGNTNYGAGSTHVFNGKTYGANDGIRGYQLYPQFYKRGANGNPVAVSDAEMNATTDIELYEGVTLEDPLHFVSRPNAPESRTICNEGYGQAGDCAPSGQDANFNEFNDDVSNFYNISHSLDAGFIEPRILINYNSWKKIYELGKAGTPGQHKHFNVPKLGDKCEFIVPRGGKVLTDEEINSANIADLNNNLNLVMQCTTNSEPTSYTLVNGGAYQLGYQVKDDIVMGNDETVVTANSPIETEELTISNMLPKLLETIFKNLFGENKNDDYNLSIPVMKGGSGTQLIDRCTEFKGDKAVYSQTGTASVDVLDENPGYLRTDEAYQGIEAKRLDNESIIGKTGMKGTVDCYDPGIINSKENEDEAYYEIKAGEGGPGAVVISW